MGPGRNLVVAPRSHHQLIMKPKYALTAEDVRKPRKVTPKFRAHLDRLAAMSRERAQRQRAGILRS